MNLQPVTLEGRTIRLEPLSDKHAPDLLRHMDDDIFKYHFLQPTVSETGVYEYVSSTLQRPQTMAFTQVIQATGEAVGVSMYMDIQQQHRNLEIGSTWLSRQFQRTAVNPEAKYLLMKHAFEAQGAIRVMLKTDSRNTQSQRAIEKLGAVKEGILRNHIIMPDGHIRHTVVYSITDDEWPSVKSRLEARLEY